jgi:hypothetical protein
MVSGLKPTIYSRHCWREVNASNPCPACNHTSWCRVTKDGIFCACRRGGNGTGTLKKDKNGEDYWLHRLNDSRNGEKWAAPRFSLADGKGELAVIDIRHQVYTRFLKHMPLTSVHKQQLTRRGIDEGHPAANYATLGRQRAQAAYALVEAGLEENRPRVPGFYVKEADNGNRFWSVTGPGGLCIPVRDAQTRIQTVLVRVDQESTGGKYRWLSSKKKGGPGSGAPIHVPLCRKDADKTTVRVTEGALKADAATRLSGILTIGLPGVSAWRRAVRVLRELGATTARVAYDTDASHNRTVADCLPKLVDHLRHGGFAVELEVWDEQDGKGIDDLLATGKAPNVVSGFEAVDSVVKRIVAEAHEADPQPSAGLTNGQVVNGYNLTDLGNAERLAHRHGSDLRHCHPWKGWLHWNGRRWEEDQTGGIYARAIDTVRGIYAEAADCEEKQMRAALSEHARNSEAAKFIRAMIDLARAQPGIPILPAEMDADPWLFNVRNGTLNLRSGQMREHRRSDHLTKLCPVEYHPDASCPTWEKFLGAIFPDDEDEPDAELITFM